jgi:hypothetical protein
MKEVPITTSEKLAKEEIRFVELMRQHPERVIYARQILMWAQRGAADE